jgi:hypothetical protein
MTLHPDQLVRLIMVDEVSHFGTSDGKLELVSVDDAGRRFVWIKAKFAQESLCNGLPESIPLREVNTDLAEALGPLKSEPGINLARYEAAQRAALAPPSKNEIIAETLQMYGRAMR